MYNQQHKSLYLLITVPIFVLVGNACAGNNFTGAGDGSSWNDPGNWSAGRLPFDTTTHPESTDPKWYNDATWTKDGTTCVIDDTMTAACYALQIGAYGGDNTLVMTGGTLDIGPWGLNIGRGGNNNSVHTDSFGHLLVSGGVISTHVTAIPEQWGNSPLIKGELVMEGGTLHTGGFHMGNEAGVGSVPLKGGVIRCTDWFQIRSENAHLNVAGGMLIINGDHVSLLQQYIDRSWIAAYAGLGELELDFDVRHAGKTTLSARIEGQASHPNPPYGAQQVSTQTILSWSPGEHVAWHRIFFGNTNPPSLVSIQTAEVTTYGPEQLLSNRIYYWRVDEVNEARVWPGALWTFTTGGAPNPAEDPHPALDAAQVHPYEKLRWMPSENVSSHDVYFGTNYEMVRDAWDPNQLSGRGSRVMAMYDPGPMKPDTTYYWRIDERNVNGITRGPIWRFTTGALAQGDGPPPYTDYCAMLSQEIQGKKHGFLAGNLAYYIGGFFPIWEHQEDETLGFTHPFRHDLRSRGHGMVEHPDAGHGHDYQGWEFYKTTKVAYGSVYIGTTKYTHPVPTAMYWRPDKMICEYEVGGVNIHEEKFIADNDVACTTISSSVPITLEFEGQSFANDKTITSTATCELDAANNAVHVVEGGTTEVKPVPDEVHTGVLMYDGISTVLSASKTLTDYTQHQVDGQWFYQFKLPCDNNGVSLVWVMDDEYARALAKKQDVLADPAGHRVAKTQCMNDLLNHQIPYFRCSDQDIVDVYYYLWSLYFMYFIDVEEGFEQYPHTQTAVNNFSGMHRYDACFQIPVGSWTVDKGSYANGNVLIWSALLPYADLSTGRIPADNLGIAWYSGLWGAVTAHVEGALQIYEHSRDTTYLQKVYDFYKGLMWRAVPGHWGYQYTAAQCLGRMAVELGYPADVDHWYDLVNMGNINNWLSNMWENNGVPHYFGAGTGALNWNGMAYMAMEQFPDDWATEMTEYWALDNQRGFFGSVPLTTKALKDWDQISDVFTVTPDTNWWAIRGMYKHHVCEGANACTLGHLKEYNMEWGIPVAPESRDIQFRLWGDQYSNFNAGKILLILEGIAGLSYSVVDHSFTVGDHMPRTWDYMDLSVPIQEGGRTSWTSVWIKREPGLQGEINKTITVSGNTQSVLKLQPWLEGKNLLQAPEGYTDLEVKGHLSYQFDNTSDKSISIVLSD